MAWWDYVQKITEGASQPAIAERVGIAQSSVNRWKTVIPKSENVISFAKAYGRPPLEALQAAGLVSDEDVAITQVSLDYEGLSDAELAAEFGKISAVIQKRLAD
ncbi:helix-turn-helix domain-containing protein [Nonomuraea bangladeshensis]|uniref:helix-turn-helix domain-containing protein n=1 Tax=Nonomuraea bangladeshensis TaxID=404385 RepID=UPI003C300A99